MFANITTWFQPTKFSHDGQKLRTKRILTILLSVVLLGSMGPLLLNIRQRNIPPSLIMMTMAVLTLILLVRVRRGNLLLASWVLPFYPLINITAIASNGDGVRSIAILGYALVLLLAGLLLGKRPIFLFAGLSLLSISGLIVAEMNGRITPSLQPANFSFLAIAVPILLVTAVVLYLLIDNLMHSLAYAQENEQDALLANEALAVIKDSLEIQIAERTQQIEQTLLEAEASQQILEKQAWLATGQAELSEQMYGIQDVVLLANNVIQHLCQYTEAQMGALFLFEPPVLKLMGSYAYSWRNHRINAFELGEGFVGQAALEQKTLTFNDIPSNYMVVASSLVTAVPNKIIVLPFLYNDQLVGVVELAYLHDITPIQLQFLETAMKNIAITFSLAQTINRQQKHDRDHHG